jgi:ketosteroid isomerase-like protein
MQTRFFCGLVLMVAGLSGLTRAQMLTPQPPASTVNPLDPTMRPGKAVLLDLEARFAKDVAERGGEAFASWFAEDGVSLSNGAAPLIGKVAIVKSAKWDPKVYQLTWTPTEAEMGPSGDMGYTWGHYEGKSKDANGNPVLTSGRYMTIWRKGKDGSWKVVLDAGANDVPEGGDCCKLPSQ